MAPLMREAAPGERGDCGRPPLARRSLTLKLIALQLVAVIMSLWLLYRVPGEMNDELSAPRVSDDTESEEAIFAGGTEHGCAGGSMVAEELLENDQPRVLEAPVSVQDAASVREFRIVDGVGHAIEGASVVLLAESGHACGRALSNGAGVARITRPVIQRVFALVSPPNPWVGQGEWVNLTNGGSVTLTLRRGTSRSGFVYGADGIGHAGYEVRARIPLARSEGGQPPRLANPLPVDASGSYIEGRALVRRVRTDAHGGFVLQGLPDTTSTIEISGLQRTVSAQAGQDSPVYLRLEESSGVGG